jgi:proteasome lid subunit RPN8/RPN11
MTPDVRELAGEQLSSGRFPVDARSDFRLYMAPEVREAIEQHANANVAVEICGVLVGRWEVDDNGPFALVSHIVRCENASSKFAEVTFTHESWAYINQQMDSRYADERIIGWYHSHPDFGIFLSDRDCFIQQHFFGGPGQIAYVIDPVRKLEGVFAWRDGTPSLLPHFWIGNQIRTAERSERGSPAGDSTAPSRATAAPQLVDPPSETPRLSWTTGVLIVLISFWVGNLLGNRRSDWERSMLEVGAVAYFADTKVLAEGLDGELSALQDRLQEIAAELNRLPSPGAQLAKQQAEEGAKRRAVIIEQLAICDAALKSINRRYALNDLERAALARLVAQKLAALRQSSNLESATRVPKSSSAGQPPTATDPVSGATD